MKLQRVGHDWVNKHITMFVCLIWWFLPLLCLSLGLHSPHIPLYFLLLSLPAMDILCCCWFSLFCFFVLFKLSESNNLCGRTIKEYKEENKDSSKMKYSQRDLCKKPQISPFTLAKPLAFQFINRDGHGTQISLEIMWSPQESMISTFNLSRVQSYLRFCECSLKR